MAQRIVSGEERAGYRRSGLERQPRGNVSYGIGPGNHSIAEAGRAKTHDMVARCESNDAGANGVDYPRELQPQARSGKTVFDSLVGQHPEGIHHIAEIKSGRTNLNFQIKATRNGAGVFLPTQVAQLARHLEP